MNVLLRVSLVVAVIIYFGCIFRLLRTGKMHLKYSLMWILIGIVMLLFILFPGLLEIIAIHMGIIDYLNGLFAFLLFGVFILLMFLTTVVSELSEKNRNLVQEIGLMDKRIRDMEEKKSC